MRENSPTGKTSTKTQQLILHLMVRNFPTKIRNKARLFFLTTTFQHHTEVLITAVKQQKEIKCMQIMKEEIKLPFFIYDIAIYVENQKESRKKLLELISNYSKNVGYRVNIQKSITFLYNSNEPANLKLKILYLLH